MNPMFHVFSRTFKILENKYLLVKIKLQTWVYGSSWKKTANRGYEKDSYTKSLFSHRNCKVKLSDIIPRVFVVDVLSPSKNFPYRLSFSIDIYIFFFYFEANFLWNVKFYITRAKLLRIWVYYVLRDRRITTNSIFSSRAIDKYVLKRVSNNNQ